MSEKHDKWHVNLYGSNQGRIYVGPLGYTAGIAEVHTVFDKEQAMKDAHLIVDAVNSVQALRDEVARLRFILKGFVDALPTKRDWLDPVLERQAKAALTPQAGAPMTAGQRWSKERPTVPGWYWFRPSEPVNLCEITPGVHMVKVNGDGTRACMRGRYVTFWNGEWCGPLVPPHDQEAG